MGIRDSASKLKKRVKHLGDKLKPGRTGDGPSEETVDTASLPSRPAPHIVAGGSHSREDPGADSDGQIRLMDQSPAPGVPEPAPACGSDDDQEGFGGGQATPHSDIGVPVGSGPSREGNGTGGKKVGRVYPSPSTPSIVHSGKPDGTKPLLFRLLSLIIPSDTAGTSTIPDHLPDTLCPIESVELSAAVGNNNPDWKSTVSATAKLLLRGVRDSADAFGPLKSVAGGLCFILENCEVYPHVYYTVHNTYSSPSKPKQINKQ